MIKKFAFPQFRKLFELHFDINLLNINFSLRVFQSHFPQCTISQKSTHLKNCPLFVNFDKKKLSDIKEMLNCLKKKHFSQNFTKYERQEI